MPVFHITFHVYSILSLCDILSYFLIVALSLFCQNTHKYTKRSVLLCYFAELKRFHLYFDATLTDLFRFMCDSVQRISLVYVHVEGKLVAMNLDYKLEKYVQMHCNICSDKSNVAVSFQLLHDD